MNHSGARSFKENPIHVAIMDSLKANQRSRTSSRCHDTIHNLAQLGRVKFWSRGL